MLGRTLRPPVSGWVRACLLGSLLLGCGPGLGEPGTTDTDTDASGSAEQLDIAVVEHVFQCWFCDPHFYMRSYLTVELRSPVARTVEVQRTSAYWASAMTTVDLPPGDWVEVVLRESIQQCGPVPTSEAEFETRFEVTVDGEAYDLDGTHRNYGPEPCP